MLIETVGEEKMITEQEWQRLKDSERYGIYIDLYKKASRLDKQLAALLNVLVEKKVINQYEQLTVYGEKW